MTTATLNEKIAALLAVLTTLGLFAVIGVMLWRGTGDSPVLQTLLGALGASWVSVVSYYFGSSAGSKAKDAVIAGRARE
ncbi:MAG: hypothetical protein ACXW3D_04850 [Caulobacteraceae bacterium]